MKNILPKFDCIDIEKPRILKFTNWIPDESLNLNANSESLLNNIVNSNNRRRSNIQRYKDLPDPNKKYFKEVYNSNDAPLSLINRGDSSIFELPKILIKKEKKLTQENSSKCCNKIRNISSPWMFYNFNTFPCNFIIQSGLAMTTNEVNPSASFKSCNFRDNNCNLLLCSNLEDVSININKNESLVTLKFKPGLIGIDIEAFDHMIICTNIHAASQASSFHVDLKNSQIISVNNIRIRTLMQCHSVLLSCQDRSDFNIQFLITADTESQKNNISKKDYSSNYSLSKESSLVSYESDSQFSVNKGQVIFSSNGNYDSVIAPKSKNIYNSILRESFQDIQSYSDITDNFSNQNIPNYYFSVLKLVCVPSNLHNSTNWGENHSNMLVTNKSNNNIIVYWVNNDGVLTVRKSLNKYESYQEKISASHVWSIVSYAEVNSSKTYINDINDYHTFDAKVLLFRITQPLLKRIDDTHITWFPNNSLSISNHVNSKAAIKKSINGINKLNISIY